MSDYPIEEIEGKIALLNMHIEESERQQDSLAAELQEVQIFLDAAYGQREKWDALRALVKESENDL